MIQSYLKIAIRHLWNQRFFTSLNLLGLAVGLAVSLTLTLHVKNELSFDRYHSQAERIYRVNLTAQWDDESEKMATVPNICGPTVREQVNEVQAQVRLLDHDFGKTAFINYGEKRFTETRLFWADSSLFQVFDIPLLQGDPATALNRPNTAVLSETTATRFFGKADPIGQLISVDNRDTLEITGVFADLPANSTLDANIFGSFISVEWAVQRLYWSNSSYETYLVLAEGADPQSVENQIDALYQKAVPKEEQRLDFWLQPLHAIHLYSAGIDNQMSTRIGDHQQVRILGMLALAVLLLACFNYVNMATARSQQRFREVGINKTLGASTGQMMRRFFVETGIVVAIALGLGVLLTEVCLPFLNRLTDKQLGLSALFEGPWALGLPLLWLAVTIGAGLYPALFLSRFSPKEVLQAQGAGGTGGWNNKVFFRQVLVVSQFTVCVGLMIAATVFYNQLNFISDKKLGYEPEQVVAINTSGALKIEQIDGLMNQYRSLAAVKSVCRLQTYPGKDGSGRSISRPGAAEDESKPITTNRATPNFEQVLGLRLLAGTTLPDNELTDTTSEVVLNESAIQYMGWTPEEAIGKVLPDLFYMGPSTVTGVVEDFHFESLHQPIGAYCFHNANSESRPHLLVKLETAELRQTMSQLEAAFKQNIPLSAFDYTFLDDHLNTLYRNERSLAQVVLVFTGLAVFIACLGLFGLAAYAAERRTKEIGIRKVLGASVQGLVGLLAKDFLKPVLAAVLLASPLAWYWMNQWLENFAYRIDVQWTVFALTGLLAVGVAFLTVSFQSVRAALMNPVKSLRSE